MQPRRLPLPAGTPCGGRGGVCKRSETSWADLIDWRVRQGSNSFPRSTPSPAVPGETAPVRSTRGSPAVTDSRPHPARPGAMRAVVRQTRVPGENRNGAASGGRGSGPALPCPPAAAGAEGAPPALPRGSAYLRSCPLPCPGPPPLAQRSGSSPPPRGGGMRGAGRAPPPGSASPPPPVLPSSPSRELTRGERRPRRRARRLRSAASTGAASPPRRRPLAAAAGGAARHGTEGADWPAAGPGRWRGAGGGQGVPHGWGFAAPGAPGETCGCSCRWDKQFVSCSLVASEQSASSQ